MIFSDYNLSLKRYNCVNNNVRVPSGLGGNFGLTREEHNAAVRATPADIHIFMNCCDAFYPLPTCVYVLINFRRPLVTAEDLLNLLVEIANGVPGGIPCPSISEFLYSGVPTFTVYCRRVSCSGVGVTCGSGVLFMVFSLWCSLYGVLFGVFGLIKMSFRVPTKGQLDFRKGNKT